MTETPSPSKPSGFLRIFFIGLALILFGILVGVLAARFLHMPGNTVTPTPTPIVTETPNPTIGDTTNWKTYENKTLGFTLQYPNSSNWNINDKDQSVGIYYYDTDEVPEGGLYEGDDKGKFNINIFYNETFAVCDHWIVEYSKTIDEYSGKLPTIISLKQLNNGNYTGLSFENGGFVGVACLNSPQGGTLNIYGNLDYQANKEYFNQIISSLKFTNLSTKYSCPTSDWVDCMPGPNNPELRMECTSEYLDWANVYCPNFKGAAL